MKKDTFLKIFSNIVLQKIVFQHVHFIHKDIEKSYLIKNNKYKIVKWNKLVKSPDILYSYGYIEQLKQYYNITYRKYNSLKNSLHYHEYISSLNSVINGVIKSRDLKLLKYLIEDVALPRRNVDHINPLRCAAMEGSMEIIQYLDRLAMSDRQLYNWDFRDAFIVSPLSRSLEVVIWFASKYSVEPNDVNTLLSNAAVVGSLDIFRWLMDHYNSPCYYMIQIWINALKCGNLDLLHYMSQLSKFSEQIFSFAFIDIAIKDCSLDIINWLFTMNAKYTINGIMINSIKRDSVEIIEWLFQHFKSNSGIGDHHTYSCAIDWFHQKCLNVGGVDNVMDFVIGFHSLEIVKWLHYGRTEGCTSEGIDASILNYREDSTKQLSVVEWLFQNRPETRCTEMVKFRFDEIEPEIKPFIVYNYPDLLPSNIIKFFDKHYEIFKYIIEQLPQFIQEDTIVLACNFGNIETVEAVHNHIAKHLQEKNICFSFEKVMFYYQQSLCQAIENNNYSIVRFICDRGFLPNELPATLDYKNNQYNPIDTAVRFGNIDIIKHINNNTVFKYYSSVEQMETSIKKGHFNVVRYLVESHHQLPLNTLNLAARKGNMEIIKYLIDNGYQPNTSLIDSAASGGSLDIVIYLSEELGLVGTTKAIDSAASHGHLEIIQYLVGKGYGCTIRSVEKSIEHGHKQTVEWLFNNVKFKHKELNLINIETYGSNVPLKSDYLISLLESKKLKTQKRINVNSPSLQSSSPKRIK